MFPFALYPLSLRADSRPRPRRTSTPTRIHLGPASSILEEKRLDREVYVYVDSSGSLVSRMGGGFWVIGMIEGLILGLTVMVVLTASSCNLFCQGKR